MSFIKPFCQRVSALDYEREKGAVHGAMLDLLEQMLDSDKLSDKEKRKKLKKFKSAYPDVYRTKFPTEEDEPDPVIFSMTVAVHFPDNVSPQRFAADYAEFLTEPAAVSAVLLLLYC